MPRSSTHRYAFTLSDEAEDGTVLSEVECRITYTFHPAQPATAPSYASGGDPPEGALAEPTKYEVEDPSRDGPRWVAADGEVLERLITWCDAHEDRLIAHAEQSEGRQ